MKLVTVPAFVGLLLLLAFTGVDAYADEWELDWAPVYLWAVALSGTQTAPALVPPGAPPDTPLPIDIGFSDVVDMLDFGLTTHFEARKGRSGILFDFGYLGLVGQTQVPLPPGLGLPGPIVTDVDLVNSFTELAYLRRFGPRERTFELLAGVRYTLLEIDVHNPDLDLPPGVPPLPDLPDLREDWIDPIVGGIFSLRFAPKWLFQVRGDLGGFGVGSGSDLTWHAYGLVGYQWKPRVAFIAGYRILDYDYQDGAEITSYDAKEDGVFFGATLHFANQ